MRSPLTDYPLLEQHQEKILIVVKTYPRPSLKYRELVCTAGVTEKGKWVRLYPISFRYMEHNRWYKKYQWIEVMIEKNIKDFRVDSYKPIESTIQVLGTPLNTDKGWIERKKIIIPTVKYQSLEEIEKAYKSQGTSLAVFKPKKILEFKIEPDTEVWSQKQGQILSQLRLFEQQPKILEKIPFKFSYLFTCSDPKCIKPHKLSIIDWELFELYRGIKQNYQYDMDVILEKVKQKWLDEMWSPKKDSYLIVGTQFPNPTFMVLGVFWPPK